MRCEDCRELIERVDSERVRVRERGERVRE